MPKSIDPIASLLSVIPLKAREKTMLAAPLFHAWGFAQWALGISLASTVVLKRKFDEEGTLSLTAQHGCQALVVVPVMIQRILELPDEVLDRYDLSAVKAVPVSGSALPGGVSNRWMDHFGENLYNLYGSTEVAWATIATPRDLREAPGTAGRPPRGSVVKIYDEDGKPLPQRRDRPDLRRQRRPVRGLHGRRQQGRARRAAVLRRRRPLRRRSGRLFIDGRDDDMIVSGGENVFPAEVEDLLHGHEAIVEAAVFGVDDDQYGQRLKAVIVKRGEITEDEVRDYVKQNLAGYKAPRDVEFVDELPRTSTGKVLKRELGRLILTEACLSARTSSISGASGSPPARAGAWTCTSTSTRSTTAAPPTPSSRSWCPCAWTSPAPPAKVGRCGCASTRRWKARACAAWTPRRRTYAVDSYEVHQPGAGDADLLSPYYAATSSTSRRGRATRSRSPCRPRSPAAPTAPACARSAARTSTTIPTTRTRREPDLRWAKLSELKFD